MSASEEGTPAAGETSRPVSFRLKQSTENYLEKIAGSNKTAFINDLLRKLETGQLVDASTLQAKEGETLGCIFNLAGYDAKEEKMTLVCPTRLHVDRLRLQANYEDLLKACAKCPRRQEHLIAIKASSKPQRPQAPRQAVPQDAMILTFTSPPFKCKNIGCGMMLRWAKEYKRPLEVDTDTEHNCQHYQPSKSAADRADNSSCKPGKSDEFDSGVHVKCSKCDWSYGSHCYDNETAERLLQKLMEHKKTTHGSDLLDQQETEQLRAVSDAIRQKVSAK